MSIKEDSVPKLTPPGSIPKVAKEVSRFMLPPFLEMSWKGVGYGHTVGFVEERGSLSLTQLNDPSNFE